MATNTTKGVRRVRYLVVGAGVAGAAAAEAARAADPTGEVALVGREVHRPYHRPPLSKSFLRGERARDELIAQPIGQFRDEDIRLVTGRRVAALDAARRRATLDDGGVIQYEQCCLAHGAAAAPLDVPGGDLPGVYALRTLEDAEQLRTRVRLSLDAGRGQVAVVGGGLLGVEVAASLRTLGLKVTLLMDAALPWHGVAGPAAGRFALNLLQQNGVEVMAESPATAVLGDGRAQRVAAGEIEVPCDFAVACVGWRVDGRPAKNTGATVSRGVHADAFGRTGVAGLWAAGDCCLIEDRRFGKLLPCGHWDVARRQGELVGRNMAAAVAGRDPESWTELPGWHTELFGVDAYAWGTPRLIERHEVVRGDGNSGAFAEVGLDADGRACHAVTSGLDEPATAEVRDLVNDRATP